MKKVISVVALIVIFTVMMVASALAADPIPVTSVSLNEEAVVLAVKKSITVKTVIEPKNATNKKLVWQSSDETIATVKNGKITAIAPGSATITVISEEGNGPQASVQVTVVQPIKKITVDNSKLILQPGILWKQSISIVPEDATIQELDWTSSNEAIATVLENGDIMPQAVGKCKITGAAKDGSKCKAVINVEVKEHEVVIDAPNETQVNFPTHPSAMRYFGKPPKKSPIQFANGCVTSETNTYLIPVKAGSDTITVTWSDGKKDTHTVFVAQSAFEQSGLITVNTDELIANTKSKIKYRDMTWGMSYNEAAEKGIINNNYVTRDDNQDSLYAYESKRIGPELIAGHELSFREIFFTYVYDDKDRINKMKSNALFYKGTYEFYHDDDKSVFLDLHDKLIEVYGQPTESDEAIPQYTWTDNGVSIILLWKTKTKATIIIYQWDEGKQINDHVLEIIATNEANAVETEEPVSDSTDGL